MKPVQFSYFPLLLLLLLAASLRGQDAAILKSGERVEGQLLGMQAGFILLQVESETGLVTRRIPPSETASLSFQNNYEDLHEEAKRRAPFLGLLSESDESLLAESLEQLIDEQRYLEALSYAKLWKPNLRHPKSHATISYLTLLASRHANLHDEALVHAKAIVQADPNASAAILAWQVIAESHLRDERWEQALWAALQPIARAQTNSLEQLEPLYEIAAQAYRKLGYDAYADALLAKSGDASPPPGDPVATHPLILPSLAADGLTFESLLKNPTPPQP